MNAYRNMMKSMWRTSALVIGLGLLLAPRAVHAGTLDCLTGTDPRVASDAPQIAAIRSLIDSACDCMGFSTHHDYVACAHDIIRAQVASGGLRLRCAALVKDIFRRSTCGYDPAKHSEVCLLDNGGTLRCRVRATQSGRCPKRAGTACASYTNCMDAADSNGDLHINAADSGACVPTPTAAASPTATPPSSIDCVVSDWSAYSVCSRPCGGGTQTRTRTIVTPPSNGGAACPALEETQPCNTQPCPVDCVVTAWGPWGACSASCGGGTQTRNRSIVTQAQNGGQACPALQEDQPCNTQPCVPATCMDLIKNGDESGVDCGGSCPQCAPGATCNFDQDCASGICSGFGVCE